LTYILGQDWPKKFFFTRKREKLVFSKFLHLLPCSKTKKINIFYNLIWFYLSPLPSIAVGGSPFPIEIIAGPVFAPNCKVEGKGLENGRVGEEGAFRIFAFDKFANPIRRGGDHFDVKIAGPVSISVNPIDCGDGSYNASYMITKSGPYKIAISVHAAQIAGSPFSVTLVEGDTHPSKTTLADATNDGICGVATIFTIHAYDVYGNPRKRGGDKFGVSLAPQQLDKTVKGELKDNGNGIYQVLLLPSSLPFF
jgi:hypothetical protein